MTTDPLPSVSSTTSRRWIFWLGALLLLAAVVAGAVWSWYRYRVWPEDTRRLLDRKNLAVAYLENEQFPKCDPLLEQLQTECPGELLPARNLLISRLLTLKSISKAADPDRYAQALKQTQAALSRLKQTEGETAIVYLLAGRLAEYTDDETTRLEAYTKAAQLDPKNPAAWVEVFLAARVSQDPIRQIQAQEALKRAYALRPDNLYLLLDVLLQQAKLKQAEIAETLVHARELAAPFAEGIQRRNRGDILEYLDRASEALHLNNKQPPDWNQVSRNVQYLNNVLRPETATQRDLYRIKPHELEYVVRDFSPKFYDAVYLPARETPPAISVSFQREDSFQLPPISDVRQAQFVDFDLDGRLDVLIVRDAGVEVHGRDAQGQWKQLAAVAVPAGMRGAIAADLDRDFREAPTKFLQVNPLGKATEDTHKTCLDADPDVCVFGEAGLVILKNIFDPQTKTRTLEIVPQTEAFAGKTRIVSAAFADLDQDGDLDLVASGGSGISLWINRDNNLGPETFDEITHRSALPPAEFQPGMIIPVDWDRNVTMDLVLAGGKDGKAGWLENLHHGRFRWQAFEELGPVQSAALVDADGNASWDLLAAGERGLSLYTTNTPTAGVVRFRGTQSIGDLKADGLKTCDYDNDGLMDFVGWNSTGITVFHGLPAGEFETKDLLPSDQPPPKGCDAGDLDGDGDLDLLFFHEKGLDLYVNEGGNANHWIEIALRADQTDKEAQRCNMQGIGSLLELKAGARYQAMTVTGGITHFGLGQQEQPDLVRVLWTNGIPSNIIQPAPNSLICEEQHLKGSCPYLYTWNGERFAFATDLLWAAPLGLQFAENVLAPSREWEYLRISGDQLKPRNGEYQIQITEELWEAAYFDLVELIAVDHPTGVEVYTNEKVGPAEIAKPRIRTAEHRRVPMAARDQTGRDVLNKIASRDEDYLKAYDRRIKQGLTEEHFLELDLGELQQPKTITLFLTGWMFPTDTSLNVGIGQNPNVSLPRPPFLLVPNAQGEWREAISSIGFPGGKTKTIAVDVPAELFAGSDYRLRIATSMEIAWDAVFFTVNEPDLPLKPQSLKLIAADLHYRGFSYFSPHPKNGPDRYEYSRVSTASEWPPMLGNFTRFGDVAELLQTEDDRLAVLAAGDEITLRFQAPPPPKNGWTRTFVLHNVGWDKDADVNTIHGETVEPLPFRGMKQYPYEPDQTAPDTPAYREYLKKYQTRRQSSAKFWKRLTAPDAGEQ